MQTALIIMAAGIGSRFKTGIKQLTTVDSSGHIIIDYSVHDALKADFNRIIFVIRRDIEEEFRSVIGLRVEEVCRRAGVEVCYAFQELNEIPGVLPQGRTKPWGTGQAVLCAREYVNMPFAVINADDYYGAKAFCQVHDFLLSGEKCCCMSGYMLKNTLSDNGAVTRGICEVENGYLTRITETRNVIKTSCGAEADGKPLDPESLVSMNMWGFGSSFINEIEEDFKLFFNEQVPSDPLKAEFLLPELVGKLLKTKRIMVKALLTPDTWLGMTYIEDADKVRAGFRKMIEEGIYKTELYSDI